MKIFFTTVILFIFSAVLYAADGMKMTGVFDSTLKLGKTADSGDSGGEFIYGIEEYANIRFRGKIGEKAEFYSAFNLIAASGIQALPIASDINGGAATKISAQNYAAAIELERLYFRIVNENTGFDAGLMRLAFGYGSVFSPSDFFNPKNPLYPDARPRAILGGLFSFYPNDDSNLRAFAAAPPNPFSTSGDGFKAGISGERHLKNFSVQSLYVFESPSDTSVSDSATSAPNGVHYFGASIKGDTFVGIWTDMLYSLNPATHQNERLQEFSASAGLDYSLPQLHLYFLFEYLFNGSYSITAASAENQNAYRSSHYLYSLTRYNASDFTNISLSAIFNADDISFTPIIGFSTSLFQGMTLTLTTQVPLDRSVFDNGSSNGEFGPVQSGLNFLFTVKTEIRF